MSNLKKNQQTANNDWKSGIKIYCLTAGSCFIYKSWNYLMRTNASDTT